MLLFLLLSNFPQAHSEVGARRHQEDRLCVAPRLDSDDCGFFAVFDGTVGDFASHTIHTLLLPHLVGNPSFQASKQAQEQAEHMKLVGTGLYESFISSDKELVQACAQNRQDYSSSTGVVAVVSAGVLTVAHLGDSRVSSIDALSTCVAFSLQ
jgi:serine/threonine protein phosphatase PrpC